MSEDWYEPQGAGLGVDEMLAVADRRKHWFAIAAVIGLVIGVVLLQVLPETYSARTTILYEPRELPKEFVRSTLQDSIEQELATLRERITSHDHLMGLIETIGRERLDPIGETSDSGLLAMIRRQVSLEIGNAFSPEAQVFELVYEAEDPQLAADIVRELTTLFIYAEGSSRSQQARMTAEFLTGEVERVAAELANLGQQLREARAKLPATLLHGQNPDVTRKQSSALEEARLKLSTAAAQWTDEHPEVKRLRREVARLESMRRSSDVVQDADTENLILYEQLQRDLDRVAANYEELRNKQLNARLSSHLEIVNEGTHFQVLSPATTPKLPDFPVPWIVILGGILGSMVLAGVMIVALELIFPSFGSVQSVADAAGSPVVASIPLISPSNLSLHGPYAGVVDDHLVALTAMESAPAEQYRSFIPTMLGSELPKVILVTSAQRADGKSVTAANLAATIALSLEREVLLVDADMRRPRVHRLFRKRIRRGLVDVLRGNIDFDEAVLSSACQRLSLLPSGRPCDDPTPLLAGGRLLDVIEKAQGRYGTIVIDAPPLLPVVDTRMLTRLADTVLFVVRADVTPRRAVVRSIEELGGVDGIIFNGVRPGPYKRYYYDDAYATYAYGEGRSS